MSRLNLNAKVHKTNHIEITCSQLSQGREKLTRTANQLLDRQNHSSKKREACQVEYEGDYKPILNLSNKLWFLVS